MLHARQFLSTDRIEDDIQHLGEHVCKMLSDMCLRKHSERLASQPQTVASLLKLFGNVAVFATDCSSGSEHCASFVMGIISNMWIQRNSAVPIIGGAFSRISTNSS